MESTPPVEVNDATLAVAWAAGDERAFEQIVARHTPRIFNRCRLALGTADADDATQAVFLVLARKGAQAAASPVLAAWLMQVAGNVVRNAVRDRGRRRHAERQAPPPPPAGEPTMSDIAGHLDACLADLPAPEREAVTLHHLAGCTLAEVGAQTGAGTSTVHARVQRGLERLRALLARRGVALSSLALVAALASEAQAAVPPAVLVHLRDLNPAGGGVGSTAAPSDRVQRWSRQRSSTMTRIALATAGLLLVGGAAVHFLPSAEQLPAVGSPTPVAPPAPAADPLRAHDYLVIRVGDLGQALAAMRSQPEMAFLADLPLVEEMRAVRHAEVAFYARAQEADPPSFSGSVRCSSAEAPLLARMRDGLPWCPRERVSLASDTLVVAKPPAAVLPAEASGLLGQALPAGVVAASSWCFFGATSITTELRVAEDGLRFRVVTVDEKAAANIPALDRGALAGLPAQAVLAGAYQLRPRSANTDFLNSWLHTWKRPAGNPGAVLDRLGAVTVLAWIEPGSPMPTLTIAVPASEDEARDLVTACDLRIGADGIAREMIGPVTLSAGWRAGRLIATTHPGGIDAVSAPGGFTAHPEIVRALATLPGQVTACTLVRPAALLDMAMPYLPLLSAEVPMPALRQYRDRLVAAQAFGLLSVGGADGRIVADMHGSLALAGCVVLANNAGTIARMLHLAN